MEVLSISFLWHSIAWYVSRLVVIDVKRLSTELGVKSIKAGSEPLISAGGIGKS